MLTANLLPRIAAISSASHATIGGDDGLEATSVVAYRLFMSQVSLAELGYGRIDDVGARPALRGRPATSLDADNVLSVQHTSDGEPQQGGIYHAHPTPDRAVWGHTAHLYLGTTGGAVERLPTLGADYAGVTVSSYHGGIARGVQVSFVFGDGSPTPRVVVSSFAADGTGARTIFATADRAWDTEGGVAIAFVWDDTVRQVHVLAQTPDADTSHLVSVRYPDLLPLLDGSQFGPWPLSPTSGILIGLETVVAGDMLQIRYIDVAMDGECLLMSGRALTAETSVCIDACVCVNEVQKVGVGGIDSSMEGNAYAAVADVAALTLPAGAGGCARIYTEITPVGPDQYVAARLRLPRSLEHVGSMSTGIALCICDGETRYQATLLHDFTTRHVGLHESGDPGIYASHAVVEHDWSVTTLVELYRLNELGIVLRVNRSDTIVSQADPDGIPDERIGAWIGQYDTTLPSSPADVQVDLFAHALHAWTYIPGLNRGDWHITDGAVLQSSTTGTLQESVTDGLLCIDNIDASILSECAGTSLQTELQIETWYSSAGYDAPRQPIGPLMWLLDVRGNGVALYAVKRGDDTWAVYIHTSASEDLGDVLGRTARGRRISVDVPDLQASPSMIRITTDPINGVRVWLNADPLPVIQTSGWLPRPDSVPAGVRAAVGIGGIGTVRIGPTVYARGWSASVRAEVPERIQQAQPAPATALQLLWGAE
jgi:hypothetical protein